MAGQFAEMGSNSWLSRIVSSLGGFLVGFAVLAGGSFLIYWNEGRTLKNAQALEEGAGVVVSVSATQVDPSNAGRLIHFSGDATTSETLTDPTFGVSLQAIKLHRRVEVFQWHESQTSHTEKRLGGGTRTVTDYNYDRRWFSAPINSSRFKHPEGHANPDDFHFQHSEQVAQNVTVGAFTLSRGLVANLNDYQRLPIDERMRQKLSPELKKTVKLWDSSYYLGKDPSSPEIGDTRVTFQVLKSSRVTVVAKQVGNTLEPFSTSSGKQLEILVAGEHSAGEVFKTEEQADRLWGWGLRAAGLFLLFIGFSLLLGPIVVLTDVMPILGSIAQIGTSFVALILAIVSFAIVFTVSWFRFRPLLATAVVAGAIGLAVLLKRMRARQSS